MLTREREKPLREGCRALRPVQRGVDEPFNVGLAPRKLALQEVKAAHDDGEHIVEVVGDAACELTTASIFCIWRSCSSTLDRA